MFLEEEVCNFEGWVSHRSSGINNGGLSSPYGPTNYRLSELSATSFRLSFG